MDKIVLITGVSRETGLGYETARQLKQMGYQVIISARNFEKAKFLAEKIDAKAAQLDITKDYSISKLANDIQENFGRLDALVNNAGSFFDHGCDPLSVNFDFARQAFDVNLFGAWRMVVSFLHLLIKSDAGRVVNVSSGAGSFTDPRFGLSNHPGLVPVYSLTKLALNGLTVKLAQQLQGTRIKVNSICPGFVATYPGALELGARPLSDGAKSIVWGVTIPDNGPSGGFFRDGQPMVW